MNAILGIVAVLLILIGAFIGVACIFIGPICAIAAAFVILKPWWISPIIGIIGIPILTLLFTPVLAFANQSLPMLLPWLLAALADSKAATYSSLLDNSKILTLFYGTTFLLVISIKSIIQTWKKRKQ